MLREVAATVLCACVLAGCAGGTREPVGTAEPTGQQNGDSVDDGGEDTRTGSVRVRQGHRARFGEQQDIGVGVYSLRGESSAQLALDVGGEAAEVVELAVGEETEVGGYTFKLVEISGGGVRVLITTPDGAIVGR